MSDKNLKPEGLPQTGTEKTEAGDPQEKMKGPLSSLIQGAGEAFTTDKTKEEANAEQDKAQEQ